MCACGGVWRGSREKIWFYLSSDVGAGLAEVDTERLGKRRDRREELTRLIKLLLEALVN